MDRNKHFLAVSWNHVAVLDNVQALFDTLHDWPEASCECFRLTTQEEAHCLAQQHYIRRFYSHPCCFNAHPMALPAAGTYAIEAFEGNRLKSFQPEGGHSMTVQLPYPAQMATSAPGKVSPRSQFMGIPHGGPLVYGAWSVVWQFGFTVADNIHKAVGILGDEDYIYPHATWRGDTNCAAWWAQVEYVNRCSRICSFRETYPAMPQRPIEANEVYVPSEGDVSSSDSAVLRKLRDVGLV